MKVPNIKFVEYINLKDKKDYNYYLRYGNFKGKDLFKLGDFLNLNFGFVKDMQEMYNGEGLTWENFIEAISKRTKTSKKDISLIPLFDLHCARLFVRDELEKINLIENKTLSHNSSTEEAQAGINEFAKYKSFLQFDQLAGGNVLNIDKIKQLPYNQCFVKMSLEADRAKFESKLNNIRTKKV